MNEPTDAEKILLKVVDLQAKHMDNALSMFLYSIDSGELIGALVEKFGTEPHVWSEVKAFEMGAQRLWQALCTIAETQGER